MNPPFEQFIQIPGPNPILRTGGPADWDGSVIESCQCLSDLGTYYLYYHAVAQDRERWPGGYRIGVATATHPLGPFTKQPGPLLDLGPKGSWDDANVACAFILKQGVSEYLMWYSGLSEETLHEPPGQERWSVGLARASNPLGPWEKHPDNPILPRFGYVGGVVHGDRKYLLYTEHPIGSRGRDYGPLSVSEAPRPEGPYTRREQPILRPGEWGEWDDGGFSEAEVSYRGGVLHCFYGGAKLHPTRLESRESIGYAWSEDGVSFTKHPRNPVAQHERNPDATAFAEVHHLIEPPLVYCYHTLRYASRPGTEDLGVQVLATQRPFSVTMPVLHLPTLGPQEETGLAACPPISLEHVQTLALTLEGTQPGDRINGLQLYVYPSVDGLTCDVDPADRLLATARSGQVRETWRVKNAAPFVKVQVSNRAEAAVSNLRVWATLKG